jgi:hypothetical protein
VQRYWGKAKDNDVAVAINVEAEGGDGDGGYTDWRDRDQPNGAPQGGRPPSQPTDVQGNPDPAPANGGPPAGRTSSARSRIVFRVEPGDAAVYVDDRFAGTGEELSSLSRGFQVPPGMHKIVVSRPGFGTESTQVDAAPGQSETVEISLDRK